MIPRPLSVLAMICILEMLAKPAPAYYAVALELGQLLRDTAVRVNPYVMLANALSAFALNLVRRSGCISAPDDHLQVVSCVWPPSQW